LKYNFVCSSWLPLHVICLTNVIPLHSIQYCIKTIKYKDPHYIFLLLYLSWVKIVPSILYSSVLELIQFYDYKAFSINSLLMPIGLSHSAHSGNIFLCILSRCFLSNFLDNHIIFPSYHTLFLNIMNLWSSLRVTEQVSH
jgi:hypothetical protein